MKHISRRECLKLTAIPLLGNWMGTAGSQPVSGVSLAGALIVLHPDADVMTRLRGRELARYLRLLTGETSTLVDRMPRQGQAILLDREQAMQVLGWTETSGRRQL
jgi:hypothetical protein